MLDPRAPAAELTRLAYSPDPAVRAAVAGHPNTPAPVLAELGAEFPAEVLNNPALPLLRLAEPGLLKRWPTRTLEVLAAAPDAPDWLLLLAAGHEKIDVQLAAVTRHSLPAEALRSLTDSAFWTIREYVARKPDLSPELLLRLAGDRDYSVRLSLASRSDLPAEVRDILSRDPHPLVKNVARLHGLE